MSTTSSLTFRLKSYGTPVDATSVVLRDPTGAYGLKRTDTGDVIIAAGTAMTHVSTGLYTYGPFTDPAPNLTYVWFAEMVKDGLTQHFQFTLVGGGSSPADPLTDLTSTIEVNAAGPRRVTGDSGSIEQHSLPDQIAADRYVASKAAAKRGGLAGVRRVRNVPPGAAGLDCDPYGFGWRR